MKENYHKFNTQNILGISQLHGYQCLYTKELSFYHKLKFLNPCSKGVQRGEIFATPPPSWQNLNCKFETCGFLDNLKVHIQSNYLTSTTLSLLQTKLAEKTANKFLCSSLFSFKFKNSVKAPIFVLGGATPHPGYRSWGTAPCPPVYALALLLCNLVV